MTDAFGCAIGKARAMFYLVENNFTPTLPVDPDQLESFGITCSLMERLALVGQSPLVPVPEIDFSELWDGTFHLSSVTKE